MPEVPKVQSNWSLEAPCFGEVAGDPRSCFVIACDHAGRRIPTELGDLGVSEADLSSHIALDIGVAQTARKMAEVLGAHLFLQEISRLVIDCNRPLSAADSIPKFSAGVPILGNHSLSSAEIVRRQEQIFGPYHQRISDVIDGRIRMRHRTVFVAMHSFTPVYAGFVRPWHAGVLYQRDSRLGSALLRLLRDEPGLVVGDNEPYRVTDQTDYSVIQYGERRGLHHVEVEVRQDLIADSSGQCVWGERLARLLRVAVREVSPESPT